MPFPIALVVAAAASVISNYINQKQKQSQMYDPSKDKGDMMMSQKQAMGLRDMGRSNVMRGAEGAMGTWRSYGAANRLPAGAMASGLRGIAGEAASRLPAVDVAVEGERQRQAMGYYDLLHRAKNQQADVGEQGRDLTEGIGMLTKAYMMWKGGGFNTGGQGDVSAGARTGG